MPRNDLSNVNMRLQVPAGAAGVWVCSAAVLLLVTAVAKTATLAGSTPALAKMDPLFMVQTRYLLAGASAMELAVAAALLLGRDPLTKYWLVAWLAVNFTVYRVIVAWLAPGRPCPCLGNLTAILPLEPATVDWGLKLMIAYFLCGSCWFLWRHFRPTQGQHIAAMDNARTDG